MVETREAPGTIERRDGRFAIRIERLLEHEPASVWAMLTEPGRLAQWLAPATIDPRSGGWIHVDFEDSGAVIDSAIHEYESPHRIAWSWGSGDGPERPLRFKLTPAEGGTRLTLALSLPGGEDGAKAAAGWDTHLEMLAAALEGVPIRFPVDYFLEARCAWLEQLNGRQVEAAI